MSSFHLFSYRSTTVIMILLSRLIFSYYLAYNLTALITYISNGVPSASVVPLTHVSIVSIAHLLVYLDGRYIWYCYIDKIVKYTRVIIDLYLNGFFNLNINHLKCVLYSNSIRFANKSLLYFKIEVRTTI